MVSSASKLNVIDNARKTEKRRNHGTRHADRELSRQVQTTVHQEQQLESNGQNGTQWLNPVFLLIFVAPQEQLLQDGNGNPSEKEERMREIDEDDLKMAKLGSISFSVAYDKQKTALVVTIIKASDLPVKDPNTESSDPYVKLQLLPDKRHKVKTRVLRKTLNPVYDEIFTFYGINYNQLSGMTLHFVALSFDRFSRDDIIGEVVYPLSGIEFGDEEISLSKEIMPRHIKVRCFTFLFCLKGMLQLGFYNGYNVRHLLAMSLLRLRTYPDFPEKCKEFGGFRCWYGWAFPVFFSLISGKNPKHTNLPCSIPQIIEPF